MRLHMVIMQQGHCILIMPSFLSTDEDMAVKDSSEFILLGFKKVFNLDTNIDVVKHHGSTDPLIIIKVLEHHGIPKEEVIIQVFSSYSCKVSFH
jgi:hypothetical protein